MEGVIFIGQMNAYLLTTNWKEQAQQAPARAFFNYGGGGSVPASYYDFFSVAIVGL